MKTTKETRTSRPLWSLVILLLQALSIHAAGGGGRGGRTRGVGSKYKSVLCLILSYELAFFMIFNVSTLMSVDWTEH